MAILKIFVFLCVGSTLVFADESKLDMKNIRFCQSALEFEKAFVYFTVKEEHKLLETQALQLAIRVSEGCDGALERYNKVFQVMKRSGIEFNQAKDLALKFSQKTDGQTDTFVEFYKTSFLENYMDMDFQSAYKIGQKFAEKSPEETDGLADDFIKIIKFCQSQKKLGLPMKTCTDFAFELADYRYLWGKKSMADDLAEFYDYIITRKDLDYNITRFIKWARRVMTAGPAGITNFKQAYEFSRRQNLSENQSVEVAIRVAGNSLDKKSRP